MVKGGEEEYERGNILRLYPFTLSALWCLLLLLSIWVMDVSNEAVMADGQLETHQCYDVAQSRGEQIKLIRSSERDREKQNLTEKDEAASQLLGEGSGSLPLCLQLKESQSSRESVI
ncbi:hypothetical protein NQZ68_030765 [Dissostichus eleginoides]|nr:hypothetical protein NQZ68_030765 [Dissostichus eleginoides]